MIFIDVVGPIENVDKFIINNILENDIELISTSSVIKDFKDVKPFKDNNPYKEAVEKLDEICEHMKLTLNKITVEDISLDCNTDILPKVNRLLDNLNVLKKKRTEIEEKIKHCVHVKLQIEPLQNFDVQVDEFFNFEFMRFRFGRMHHGGYEKLQYYLDKFEVIVQQVSEDEDYIYLMYFMPTLVKETIDNLFASLYFERIHISDEVKGTPKEAMEQINLQMHDYMIDLANINKAITTFYDKNFGEITYLYSITHQLDQVFNARKYLMHSKTAFYLAGWIPQSQLESFKYGIKEEKDVTCVTSDEYDEKLKTPTKLKNNKFLKPFEILVNLYGVPSYNEIDPTLFVAITYLILFGFMFGDLGQGIIISLAGYIFYKKKKNGIGFIAFLVGISSSIFGLIYGSFFGNEEIIGEIIPFLPLIEPMHDKLLLLAIAIGFGVFLIIVAMIINIFKQLRNKNYGKAIVDKNGVIGLLFYLILLVLALDILVINKIINNVYIMVLLVMVPVFLLFLSHPLQKIINRKKPFDSEEGKVLFFIESFFELFETILSIFSNTVSFVRVGAFALTHVGFFMAVQLLGSMFSSTGNIIVLIFGNILIIGLEGMIVTIQGLRLEYYELFSKFYEGDGVAFQPFKIKASKER